MKENPGYEAKGGKGRVKRRAKYRCNEEGQLTLFDSILFFVILLIASGLFLQVGAMMAGSSELAREQAEAGYADRARLSLMASNIPCTFYRKSGEEHQVYDKSVQYLLIQHFVLLASGVVASDIDFHRDIRLQANRTIDRTYNWAIVADTGLSSLTITKSYASHTIGISGLAAVTGDEVHASGFTTLVFGTEDEISIGLYLWK